jgi:hypothetical protein
LKWGQGLPPLFSHAFSASGIHPPLRSGQVSIDEAEYFPAQLVNHRRYSPMVFGIIPECRSASLRNERFSFTEIPARIASARIANIAAKRSAGIQLLEWHKAKVSNLTGTEIWQMIVGRHERDQSQREYPAIRRSAVTSD